MKANQPTVSDEELNKIICQGWNNAEKLKAQKEARKQTHKVTAKPKKKC